MKNKVGSRGFHKRQMIEPAMRKKSVKDKGMGRRFPAGQTIRKGEKSMMCSTRKRSIFVCALLVMMLMGSMTVLAAEGEAEYVPDVYATFWALVPQIGRASCRERV